MDVDAVVFDLDDTLIDWWGSVQRCLASFAGDEVVDALLEHCRSHCWQIRPGTSDHVWHRNNWMIHELRHELWPSALDWLDTGEVDLLLTQFDDELWVGFFPDAVPALDQLAQTHRLAVLSNNHHLSSEVERLRLHDWIEVALTAHPEPKPHPSAFMAICDQLGTEPSRTAYVGDSIKSDALGALGAGLVPIWLDRWDDPWSDRPSAVHRVTSLAELPALLAP